MFTVTHIDAMTDDDPRTLTYPGSPMFVYVESASGLSGMWTDNPSRAIAAYSGLAVQS